MNFDAVFSVKKEFEKETFLRELLIKLGRMSGTPVDVVDAEFKDVEESVKEVIVCTAEITGTCTASIGYDRQEAYTDYETYKEKIGDTYVTRQRPVTKYKTVTDWKIFQTQYAGDATCAAFNSDEYQVDDGDIVLAIRTTNANSVVEKGEATVNSAGLAVAVSSCKTNVELREVSFPGDRKKDVKYNSDYNIKTLSCYKLPFYEVTYTYNGKDYKASCFACGEINIHAETPPNDIDITAIVEENTEDLANAKKKSWTLFTISIIAAFVLCFVLKFPWLFPIPIVLLLKAKKDSDKHKEKYEEYSDKLSKNVGESKISALKVALEKHGFEPMNKELSDELESYSVPGAKELKPIKGRVVLSWVLTAILTISSLVTANSVHQKNIHSPKHVNIKVVEKDERYDPNASPYINGCYYIDLEYEIKPKKVGVEYIQLVLHVKDKKGNELGTINSSLEYLEIEKGKKETVISTLEENQPENNEFFVELYEADIDDLKFEIEVESIRFADGEYYHGD